MDYRNRISQTLLGRMFFRTFKTSSGTLYEYDDILLRTYLDIARTGDFRKLIKSGTVSDHQCLKAWEELIKKQEKVTGLNHYGSLLQLFKGYASLVNDHTVVRACLVHLMYSYVDWEVIEVLKKKGYGVEIVDGVVSKASIHARLRQVENLVTKATMKQKEIKKILEGSEEKREAKGFEEVLANLNFALGFTVDENITLARYNEYQRILKARQKEMEKKNGRDKRK